MGKVYLLFGIHNHQPTGNFDYVFEKACNECYLPFLQVLSEFPRIKCNIHFSGCLFDWLIQNKKTAIISLLKDLAGRAQAEFLTAGYYEPILSIIPYHDAVAQIKKMSSFIQEEFGQFPKGAWLTERVWQPFLPMLLKQAGVEFTLVDDAHFNYAGIAQENIFGYYTTEYNGFDINVFPISKTLRYKIPFSTLPEIEKILQGFKQEQDVLLTIVDDGEKFGMWPHTYDWVYNKNWLRNFFRLLEDNNSWVEAITFSRARRMFSPQGIIYLPAASYSEMMEWVLEYEPFLVYKQAKEKIQKILPQAENFLRAGFFNNFFRKYPRINYMQKRMGYLSRRLEQARGGKNLTKAREFLYKSQCNCAYWHGVFGGFYLGHLRSAVYQNIIEAEKEMEKSRPQNYLSVDEADFDFDSAKETIVSNKEFTAVFSQKGGCLKELSFKPVPINFINTITRRKENYHAQVWEKKKHGKDSPRTIHDIVQAKETGLEKYLVYDVYEKTGFIDHIVQGGIEEIKKNRFFASFAGDIFQARAEKNNKEIILKMSAGRKGITLIKTAKITSNNPRIDFGYQLKNLNGSNLSLAVEFNLFIPSLDSAYYQAGGIKQDLRQEGEFAGINGLIFADEYRKVFIEFILEDFSSYICPVYSVSSSESGFEKNYQQICVFLVKSLKQDKIRFSLEMGRLQ